MRHTTLTGHTSDVQLRWLLLLLLPVWGMARCHAPGYGSSIYDMDTHEKLWSQEWGIVCVWGSLGSGNHIHSLSTASRHFMASGHPDIVFVNECH